MAFSHADQLRLIREEKVNRAFGSGANSNALGEDVANFEVEPPNAPFDFGFAAQCAHHTAASGHFGVRLIGGRRFVWASQTNGGLRMHTNERFAFGHLKNSDAVLLRSEMR